MTREHGGCKSVIAAFGTTRAPEPAPRQPCDAGAAGSTVSCGCGEEICGRLLHSSRPPPSLSLLESSRAPSLPPSLPPSFPLALSLVAFSLSLSRALAVFRSSARGRHDTCPVGMRCLPNPGPSLSESTPRSRRPGVAGRKRTPESVNRPRRGGLDLRGSRGAIGQ